MRKVIATVATIAALGSVGLMAPAQAAETPNAGKPLAALQKGDLTTAYSQYYGRRWGGGGYYRGGYGWGRPYYRHNGWGSAAAAGAIGLATGAIVGGALAQQHAPAPTYVVPNGGGAEAYCAQRFRSYDPASGTYLGYDGARHSCP